MNAFYRGFRFTISLVMRLFFKIDPPVDPHGALAMPGPVMFVGNHPNGLIDPGLIFILANRHVTFLSKQPLFAMPVLGSILRGLGALPVYRKQDSADMSKNDATLTAAAQALVQQRAITIFPEGKSHSEPQLAALKTGCARIALDAQSQGAQVTIVPIGLTYEAKQLFRSGIHVEVGAPVSVAEFAARGPEVAVRELTQTVSDALRAVTLNLEEWSDLPLVKTSEALYALREGAAPDDPERTRAFAKGLSILREEQPARFDELRARVSAFRDRLDLLRVTPAQLKIEYAPQTVAWFVVKNLAWLLTLPLFLVGFAVFFLPYWVPLGMAVLSKADDDTQSTFKMLTAMLIAPLYWALLVGLAAWFGGAGAAVVTFVTVPLLALFTREFFERRTEALNNARVFLSLSSRKRLRARLSAEGDALAAEIHRVASELKPRVV